MHLDLLPGRHARWHSHHNLLPGMVDEELLTRLDARRHLYGKEWHAPHKWVGCACRLASTWRVAVVCGNDRFAVLGVRGPASGSFRCNFEMKTADSSQRARTAAPRTCEALVSARLARRGRGRLGHRGTRLNCCRQQRAPSARRAPPPSALSEMTVGGPSCVGQPRLPHGGRTATLAALALARKSMNASIEHWQSLDEAVAVPKLLHQTWKSCTLPWRQAFWREECRRVLPGDWTLLLHTDEDNRAFMAREFPDYLDLYDGYELSIQRVDAVRYFYLYRYGGVYMDLDFTCLRPLEELPLTAGRVSLGFQHGSIQTSESVANAFMVAPPRHPFIAMLIERLRQTARLRYWRPHAGFKVHPMKSTGCGFLTRAVRAAPVK